MICTKIRENKTTKIIKRNILFKGGLGGGVGWGQIFLFIKVLSDREFDGG